MRLRYVSISFVLGVAMTAGFCSIRNRINEQMRQVHLRSDVYDPMRTCLEDIEKTMEGGEVDVARRKMRVLRERWGNFIDGGPPPELFVSDVSEVK